MQPGLNLAGSACPTPGLTASALLQTLANEGAPAIIQRYNPTTGRFETAAQDAAGAIVGKDFPILPAEAYLLHMREGITGFRP